MAHAHLVNMGSPGTYQATQNQLFEANGLTTMKISTNPDSSKMFGILSSERCQPNCCNVNTTPRVVSTKEPETSKMDVRHVPDKEARDQSPCGTQASVKRRNPRKLKNRHKKSPVSTRKSLNLEMLWDWESCLRTRNPSLPISRNVISGMETNLVSPLSEVDVKSIFHEGLIQDTTREGR